MSHLLQLLLILALIVSAAKLAGAAANRIGQPAVFGEILAGLLLGPTALDILGWPLFATPVGAHETVPLLPVIHDLAEVGVILLMFIAGLETDLDEMRRVGVVAFWAAVGGVVLPLIGGAAIMVAFGRPLFWEGIFVGTIMTATSVSISAQTLIELGALRTREGSTILGAAVIDDVLGILLLSFVVAFARSGDAGGSAVLWVVLRMTAYFAGALVVARALPSVLAFADRLKVSQGLLAATLAVALLYAWAAEHLGGVAAITGSYLAGVLLARTTFRRRIDAGIHPLTYSMLVPVFFISIGLRANGRELGAHALLAVLLIAAAIVTKALGCWIGARATGFSAAEATRVGAGMISRGEVGLIVAGYGLANGLIEADIFSASVVMVLVTTMITPPLLRLTFPRQPAAPAPIVEETIAGPPEEADQAG